MCEVQDIVRALKPLRCPKCGAEIHTLNYYEKAWSKATFGLIEIHLPSGEREYRRDYRSWDTVRVIDVEYRCPECDEVLFTSEEEAEKFLRGEE